jgi:peptidoglycan-N-acetylglucosamine deacetylase
MILEALARSGVKAVFFSEGAKMEQFPELAIATIQAGHILANHAFTHPHFSQTSAEQAKSEIERTDAVIEKLYHQAGVARPCRLFRFPYGDKGDGRNGFVFKWWLPRNLQKHAHIQGFLREMGYTHLGIDSNALPKWYVPQKHDADTHWTFDVMEWSLTQQKPVWKLDKIEKIYDRIEKQHPRDIRGLPFWQKRWMGAKHETEIILMHDQEGLGLHFSKILAQLQQKVEFIAP